METKQHKPSDCPLRDKDEYAFGCTKCMPIPDKEHICCDGECNHDDCCGKVEANCPMSNKPVDEKTVKNDNLDNS